MKQAICIKESFGDETDQLWVNLLKIYEYKKIENKWYRVYDELTKMDKNDFCEIHKHEFKKYLKPLEE
jgi:hypothetical protein